MSIKEAQTWKSKKLPLWAECLEKEKSFGVFLDKLSDDGDLAVTIYAGSDIVTVRLTDSRVLVTVNETPLTDGKVRQVTALDVWRYSDQLVIVNTQTGATPYHAFTLRYTRDYVLMEVQSSIMDGGRLCGICAPNIANHND